MTFLYTLYSNLVYHIQDSTIYQLNYTDLREKRTCMKNKVVCWSIPFVYKRYLCIYQPRAILVFITEEL